MIYLLLLVLFFIIEIAYIKIAAIKNIKDKPNYRSSHTKSTIRGGGIIFIIAIIVYYITFFTPPKFVYFLISVLIVAVISFIDDIKSVSSKTRILIHILAFTILFYGLGIFQFQSITDILIFVISYIFSIGFLNIYNFMDGINGVTFLNALITYSTLWFLNEYYIEFTDSNLLVVLIIATFVFGFFNFRNKAKCFAGDIGSITIGFSIIYFTLKLYLTSNNPLVFSLLIVYLIDGGWTILERIFEKENIFEAHKKHLYQLLANDLKISHLKVATFYFLAQLIINALVYLLITRDTLNPYILSISLLFIFSIGYIIIKRNVKNKIALQTKTNNDFS